MGVVYKTQDSRLGRFVALKFLPSYLADDQAALLRFQREAQSASALNHPNICTIFDIGEEKGRAFIAMEYLEGASIEPHDRGWTAGKRAPVTAGKRDCLRSRCGSLGGKFIHRDIKPANIFVTSGDTANFWTLDWRRSLSELLRVLQVRQHSMTSSLPAP